MSQTEYLDALRYQREQVLQALDDQFDHHDSWFDALHRAAHSATSEHLNKANWIPARVRGLAVENLDTSKRMCADTIRALRPDDLQSRWTLERLQEAHECLLETVVVECQRFRPPISSELDAQEKVHMELVGKAMLQFDAAAGRGKGGTGEACHMLPAAATPPADSTATPAVVHVDAEPDGDSRKEPPPATEAPTPAVVHVDLEPDGSTDSVRPPADSTVATLPPLRVAEFKRTDVQAEVMSLPEQPAGGQARGSASGDPSVAFVPIMTSRQTVVVTTAKYTFKRNGDHWKIQFGDENTTLNHEQGVAYISHLLQNPYQEIQSLQLEGVKGKSASAMGQEYGDALTIQKQQDAPAGDEELLKDLRVKLRDLDLALAERKTADDEKESEIIARERIDLLSAVKTKYGFTEAHLLGKQEPIKGHEPRLSGGNEFIKAFGRVKYHIDKIKDKIELPAYNVHGFAAHIRKHIHEYGNRTGYIYTPVPNEIIWVIS